MGAIQPHEIEVERRAPARLSHAEETLSSRGRRTGSSRLKPLEARPPAQYGPTQIARLPQPRAMTPVKVGGG